MPAHSLAAARGVRTLISVENSCRHEHPRSMNDGKRVSKRRRCPTGGPAERCSSHSGWARPGPPKAIRKRSPAAFASRPRNRANSFAQGRDVAAAVQPISDAACFVESTTSVKELLPRFDQARHRTNPREKFFDPIEQRVRLSHVWGMIRAGQLSQAVYS
jgi:hypothetical protein